MSLLHSMEKKLLAGMQGKLEVVTEIDEDRCVMIATTSWDGIEIDSRETDLEPLVRMVAARIDEGE